MLKKKKRRVENSTGKQVNWKQVSVMNASVVHKQGWGELCNCFIKSGRKGGKGLLSAQSLKASSSDGLLVAWGTSGSGLRSCQSNNVFLRDGPASFSKTMPRHILHVFRQRGYSIITTQHNKSTATGLACLPLKMCSAIRNAKYGDPGCFSNLSSTSRKGKYVTNGISTTNVDFY